MVSTVDRVVNYWQRDTKYGTLFSNLLPQSLHCLVESDGFSRSQLDRMLLPLVNDLFKNSNTGFQIFAIEILLLARPTKQ